MGKPPFRNRKWGGQVRGQLCPDPQRIRPPTNPKPVWPSAEETGFTAPETRKGRAAPGSGLQGPLSVSPKSLCCTWRHFLFSPQKRPRERKGPRSQAPPFHVFSERAGSLTVLGVRARGPCLS